MEKQARYLTIKQRVIPFGYTELRSRQSQRQNVCHKKLHLFIICFILYVIVCKWQFLCCEVIEAVGSSEESVEHHSQESRSSQHNWMQFEMCQQQAMHQHFVHHQPGQMCPTRFFLHTSSNVWGNNKREICKGYRNSSKGR